MNLFHWTLACLVVGLAGGLAIIICLAVGPKGKAMDVIFYTSVITYAVGSLGAVALGLVHVFAS